MEAPREHLPAGRPVAGCLRLRHAARRRRALHVVWTTTWSIHTLRFRPCRARRLPVERARVLEHSGRRLAAGEPPRAVPQHAL
jgi:hypothetical protein